MRLNFLLPVSAALLLTLAAAWYFSGGTSVLGGTEPQLPASATKKSSTAEPAASTAQKNESAIKLEARAPSGMPNEGLAELEGASSSRWSFRKNAGDGFVTKMADGRLHLDTGSPEEATELLLRRFGKRVFGFDSTTSGELQVVREEDTIQVIVPQELNGLPVYGARGNFIFDSSGSLIYAVSDVYRGPMPAAPLPAISSVHAAQAARQGLLHYLSSSGAGSDNYPLEKFQGRLMYRLVGESVSLVYRYELVLSPPLIGDMEIMIDASSGAVVIVQNQTRK